MAAGRVKQVAAIDKVYNAAFLCGGIFCGRHRQVAANTGLTVCSFKKIK